MRRDADCINCIKVQILASPYTLDRHKTSGYKNRARALHSYTCYAGLCKLSNAGRYA